jgi:hypothetical protein
MDVCAKPLERSEAGILTAQREELGMINAVCHWSG